MKRALLLSFSAAVFLSISTALAGGDLPMPPQVRAAYDNGTRAWDGTPGVNYWQNRADYDIRISIDTRAHSIDGLQDITYRNDSPDTLHQFVIKLYLNMNRPGAQRLSSIGEEALTDGMVVRALSVDGADVDLDPASRMAVTDGTLMTVTLPAPLAPGAAARLTMRWTAAIPKAEGVGWENPRMGWYERDAMFLGYFYPRIAMYDDVRGWDRQPYDGVHEFYHEYGDFSLEVTLPAGYGVWATGTLQNADEVLPSMVRDRLTAALQSDTAMHIVTPEDLDAGVYGSEGVRIWRFAAPNVTDVAVGVGKYLWDAAGSEVAPGTRVLAQAVYEPAAASFTRVATELSETLRLLSTEFPGVPYAYPQLTVFHGHSGMEFPMILNDGEFQNRVAHVYVHAHEAAHSWFPFMVGVDESRWGWMEEGMAYFLPVRVQEKQSGYDHRIRAAQGYARFAGRVEDYPLMIPSSASPFNEWQMLDYYKASVAFDMLRRTLGDERFTTALRAFIEVWQGKHPLPWDFFHTFDAVSGEDLSWFWKPWFFEYGRPDLAVDGVEQDGGTVRVHLRRAGSMPVPVEGTLELDSGDTVEFHENTRVWQHDSTFTVELPVQGRVASVTLGNRYIPDSDPSNNSWTAPGK